MVSMKRINNLFMIIVICVPLFLFFSCGSKIEYVGVYQTNESKGELKSEIELNEHGEGYWRVGYNEEFFSWYSKGDEIRLNTRKGGVIVAKIKGETLVITLSGGKKLIFTKIK